MAPTVNDPVYSGFAAARHEDILGITLTSDQTNLTWAWDGTCATGGATSGAWAYHGSTGWQIDSSGGTNTTTCNHQTGETYSSFHNSAFCAPLTTYVNYSYVDFYGFFDGTWDGARYDYYSGSCAPLYEFFVINGPA